jgi:DNA-binding MarR family transcriptional regulator
MPTLSPPPGSPETILLLQRILRLRSHFKVVAPENLAALRKQIHETHLSGKDAGIEDAGLFFNAGSVFACYDGPITMGELSRDLEVPLSTATRTMDWLVSNDYARRLPDPKDRRIVRVELTGKGQETYAAIRAFMLSRVEQALSQLNTEERQVFLCLVNKVLSTFEEAQ